MSESALQFSCSGGWWVASSCVPAWFHLDVHHGSWSYTLAVSGGALPFRYQSFGCWSLHLLLLHLHILCKLLLPQSDGYSEGFIDSSVFILLLLSTLFSPTEYSGCTLVFLPSAFCSACVWCLRLDTGLLQI